MGASHARAYDKIEGFELAGLCARRIAKRTDLPTRWSNVPRFADYDKALETLNPDVVSINTWPDTHADFAIRAFKAGAHVFMEKPIAETVKDAKRVLAAAPGRRQEARHRLYPARPSLLGKFVELAKGLGKPLVMRMNSTNNRSADAWTWHKNLMKSLPPIVDCGVHYVDVMCQMTGAKPVRVHGIGAHLTKEVRPVQLRPSARRIRRRVGRLVRGGLGPDDQRGRLLREGRGRTQGLRQHRHGRAGQGRWRGGERHDLGRYRHAQKTNAIRLHHSKLNKDNSLAKADELFRMDDEPSHDELCEREQLFLLDAIRRNVDLSDHMEDAVNSLRIVLAADESVHNKKVVTLR